MKIFISSLSVILLFLGGTDLGEQLKLEEMDLLIPLLLIGGGIGLPIIFIVIPELTNDEDCELDENYDSYQGDGGDSCGDDGSN